MNSEDFKRFGYTSGCPRCEHELKYGKNMATMLHSERCRARIMEEFAKTPDGQRRIQSATERMDVSMGEHGMQLHGGPDIFQGVPAAQGSNGMILRVCVRRPLLQMSVPVPALRMST